MVMVSNNSELELLIYIAIYYVIIGLITFIIYGLDKQAAKKTKQRIPEKTLHLFSLIGGCFGAFVGQRIFRHKTRKVSFLVIYWLTAIINILFVVLIYLTVTGMFK